MKVYTYKKEIVTLADEPLAAGGEGEVRRVRSCPSRFKYVCAKIYFKPKQTTNHERKIRFMVENPPENFVGDSMMIAWPLETIYSQQGDFLGFLMPTAFPESEKLVILTLPKLKKKHKEVWCKFDKEVDIRTALFSRMKLINNIAIPVHLLHATGKYVLKDFKPDNVLVTPSGKVTVVDMDSIQICDKGKLIFPGTAATEGYVPPEFYNQSVGKNSGVPLEKSWDNFAVAVVCYQLLFGLNPYTVTPKTDKEDCNNIPYCIANNLFPFGRNASKIAVVPKPHNNFNVVPQSIRDLFIRAFSDNPDNRPQAAEWVKTVKMVIQKTPKTSSTTSHPQTPTRKHCPHCGADISPTANFCKTCGKKLDGGYDTSDSFSSTDSFTPTNSNSDSISTPPSTSTNKPRPTYCPKCGHVVSSTSIFCNHCGTRVKGVDNAKKGGCALLAILPFVATIALLILVL